ncbi:MAG: IS3 family transposase [bacterium]
MILEAHKKEVVALIEEAHYNGARYWKCCEVVEISLRTLQRWKREGMKDRRKGAKKRVVRKLSPEQNQEIISVCTSREFRDLSPHHIVPRLLDRGIYLGSVRTIYRVLKDADKLHHRSNCRVRRKRSKPPERKADASNKVWCWDITWLPCTIRGLFFYAYVIIDIYDRSIVGWSVHTEESEVHSRDLFERVSQGRNIMFSYLHSDNGKPMKGSSLTAFLKDLEVDTSFSRPRTSNDNPFIESFFRTLKYSPKYPLRFEEITEAREWTANFVNWYNTEHRHSALDYVTPHEKRFGKAEKIYAKRNKLMQQIREENPEIWGKRNAKRWGGPDAVFLNPEKDNKNYEKTRQLC